MNLFELGYFRYGEHFKRVVVELASMKPYIDLPFEKAFPRQVERALWYLDGKVDTPLWFWKNAF
jgi:hypothetical protein